MKQHLVLGAVGALVLVPVAAPAHAAAPGPIPAEAQADTRAAMRTVVGKTVSFKGGKLRAKVAGRNADFVVNTTTQCGSSRGNRGVTIKCSTLGQKRYLNKTVRIGWYTDAKKRRVAALVSVILSK